MGKLGGPILALGIILVLLAGAVCWVVFRASKPVTPAPAVMPVSPAPAVGAKARVPAAAPVAAPAVAVASVPAPQVDWEKRCGELQKELDAARDRQTYAEKTLRIVREENGPALQAELVKLRLAKDAIESNLQKAVAEQAASAKALAAANEASALAKSEAAAATQAAKLSASRAAELDTARATAEKELSAARAAADKSVGDLTKRVKEMEASLATAQAAQAAADKRAAEAAKRLQDLEAQMAAPKP